MPKTNDATGATIYGNEGIVQAATGRLDQVDPSRNPDGSVIEGFESDEREIEEPRERFEPQTADVAPQLNEQEAERQEELRDAALAAPLSLDGKMSGQEEAEERAEKKDETAEQPVSPADSQRGSEVAKGDTSSDGNSSQTSAKKSRSAKNQ